MDQTKREAQNLVEILKRELKECKRRMKSLEEEVGELQEEREERAVSIRKPEQSMYDEYNSNKLKKIISDLRKEIQVKENENGDLKKLNEHLQKSVIEGQSTQESVKLVELMPRNDFKSRMLEKEVSRLKEALHRSEKERQREVDTRIHLEMRIFKLQKNLEISQMKLPGKSKWQQLISESVD
jgi:hypothetical protein